MEVSPAYQSKYLPKGQLRKVLTMPQTFVFMAPIFIFVFFLLRSVSIP